MLTQKQSNIFVLLRPVGFTRPPKDIQEVRQWLVCMLISLKHWHGCNYCHGDISNIVYVPAPGSAYWAGQAYGHAHVCHDR